MSDESENGRVHPAVALLPALTCGAAPFYYQGLAGLIVGLAGAGLCFAAVRSNRWSELGTTMVCVAIVALTYGTIGGIIGGSAVVSSQAAATQSARIDVNDEAARRKVFAMAMRSAGRLEVARAEFNAAVRAGEKTRFLKSRLSMREDAHASQLASAQSFYRLTAAQFDNIINEGIAEGWE